MKYFAWQSATLRHDIGCFQGGLVEAHPVPGRALKIEPHRKGPAGLRQALWEDLRATQAQRS